MKIRGAYWRLYHRNPALAGIVCMLVLVFVAFAVGTGIGLMVR